MTAQYGGPKMWTVGGKLPRTLLRNQPYELGIRPVYFMETKEKTLLALRASSLFSVGFTVWKINFFELVEESKVP